MELGPNDVGGSGARNRVLIESEEAIYTSKKGDGDGRERVEYLDRRLMATEAMKPRLIRFYPHPGLVLPRRRGLGLRLSIGEIPITGVAG